MKLKEALKKKKILFPLISIVQLVILVTIANVFDLETEDTLFGGVFVLVVFGTFIGFLIKIIRDHGDELSKMKMPPFMNLAETSVLTNLYFLLSIIIFGLVVGLVLFLLGVLG